MIRKSAILVICFLNVLLIAFLFQVSSGYAHIEKLSKAKWIQGDKFGFPVWIADNHVFGSSAFNQRHIFMFLDAANFTERNIIKLFTSVADEFKVPDNLEMLAYSDRVQLQKAIDAANEGCVQWINRRTARNYEIWSNPPPSGYMRAEYRRSTDGREAQIWFSPNPRQEHLKSIYHINPTFEYPDSKRDFISAAERGDLEGLKLRMSQDKSGELLRTAAQKPCQPLQRMVRIRL